MRFSDDTGLDVVRTCAALTFAVLPVVVVFAIAQRRIIDGMTGGAVKG